MKFISNINYDRCDSRLAEDLRIFFEKDPVFVFGDWSAPNVKFQEPSRNKDILKYLEKSRFSIYMINEYKTSSCCSICPTGEMENFKKNANPRPLQREKFPNVLCHGLLRCKNKACLVNGKGRLFNRDTAAAINFRLILNSLREEDRRPPRFIRTSKVLFSGLGIIQNYVIKKSFI
ncbi:hypothetical protein J3Q64DRAFT_1672791 [Phycomyces blakesleeanus]